MALNDLQISLIFEAIDLATKDIDGIHEKLSGLRDELLKNNFQRAGDEAQGFGEAVAKLSQPLDAAASKVMQLNGFLTLIASTMAGVAYNASVDYETALAGLGKLLEGGMPQAQAYGKALDELALKYGQNGQALVAAMTTFASAGYSAADSAGLVENSIKLMMAGDIEAADASQALIAILKGFNAPATESGKALDILAAVSGKYNTTVNQLAEGMRDLSPIASKMGFSMEETAGILTPIIEIFGSGAEAADGLKTGLQKMTDTSGTTVAALSQLGVAQTDANGKLRSGKDIFMDVARAIQGLSAEQQNLAIQNLVGIEQSARMGAVLTNLGKVTEITTVGLESTGAATQLVDTALATAQIQINQTTESFRQLAVAIGSGFKKEVTGVVDATGLMADAFKKAVESGDLAPLLNAIRPQINAVEDLFRAMGDNLGTALKGVDFAPIVNGLKDIGGELGEAFAALTKGYDLHTMEGLRALIQDIVNKLGNFAEVVGGVVDGLKPFAEAVNAVFAATSRAAPDLSRMAGQVLGLGFSANNTIPIMADLASKVFGLVGKIVNVLIYIGLFTTALRLLAAAGVPVYAMLGSLASGIPTLLGVLGRLPVTVGLIGSALTGLSGAMAGLVLASGGVGYGIGTLINTFVEWATNGQTIGTMLYDLTHDFDNFHFSLIKSADAAELAADGLKEEGLQFEAMEAKARRYQEWKTKKEEEEKKQAEDAIKKLNEQKIAESEYQARIEAVILNLLGLRKKEAIEISAARAKTQEYTQELLTNAESLDKVSGNADKLIKTLNLLDPTQLLGLVGAIGKAEEASKGAGVAIRDKLQKALEDLDAASLSRITQGIIDIGPGAQKSAAEIKQALDMVIDASLKKLGVEADQVLTGIGKGFRENLAEMDAFKQAWAASGKSATDAGKVIAVALTGLMAKTKTVEEVDAINAKFHELTQGIANDSPVYQALAAQMDLLTQARLRDLDAARAVAREEATLARQKEDDILAIRRMGMNERERLRSQEQQSDKAIAAYRAELAKGDKADQAELNRLFKEARDQAMATATARNTAAKTQLDRNLAASDSERQINELYKGQNDTLEKKKKILEETAKIAPVKITLEPTALDAVHQEIAGLTKTETKTIVIKTVQEGEAGAGRSAPASYPPELQSVSGKPMSVAEGNASESSKAASAPESGAGSTGSVNTGASAREGGETATPTGASSRIVGMPANVKREGDSFSQAPGPSAPAETPSNVKYGEDAWKDKEKEKFKDGGLVRGFASGGAVDDDPAAGEKFTKKLNESLNDISTLLAVQAMGHDNPGFTASGAMDPDNPASADLMGFEIPKRIKALQDLINAAPASQRDALRQQAHTAMLTNQHEREGTFKAQLKNPDRIGFAGTWAQNYQQQIDAYKKYAELFKPNAQKDKTALDRGGSLPGHGGGDIVPAMLEPGEYVVNKEAVDKYGRGYMSRLNARKLRGGGPAAGTESSPTGAAESRKVTKVFQVNLAVPGSPPVTLFGDEKDADKFLRALKTAKAAAQ